MTRDTRRAVGIEEEFLLVTRSGHELSRLGEDVADEADHSRADGQFEHELQQAQVELGTEPAFEIDAVRANLTDLRRQLAVSAADQDCLLIASGTSPTEVRTRTTPSHRYLALVDEFGAVARHQLTCAMHVHVDVSPHESAAVLNGLAPWLSTLVALSANSPIHDGDDTGYASYRTMLWGMWPSAGPTERFDSISDYHELTEDLISIGAAHDDAMVYFDARLSAAYPTVEIRVCDVCPDVDTAVTIAALIRALVDDSASERAPTHRVEILRAATWRAARYGMSDRLADLARPRPRLVSAWTVVEQLVDRVGAALERNGDADLVHHGLTLLRERGTGADRQRAAHRDGIDGVLACSAVSASVPAG